MNTAELRSKYYALIELVRPLAEFWHGRLVQKREIKANDHT